MDFETYREKFVTLAEKDHMPEEYIQHCLEYAKPLLDRGFPVIYDDEHFSRLVGIDLYFLYKMAFGSKRFYRYFTIPKKSGKRRKIAEPLPMLKDVQHFILREILLKEPCDPCSKAYKPGASLKGNARFHRGQPVLLKLDIEDYFPSLHVSRVYRLFRDFGYSKSVSSLLAKLCTLRASLPQGAPTSPYLSNLLTKGLDRDIYSYCRENGQLRYTRYADDIAISGNFNPAAVIPAVAHIIDSHGLRINRSKTHVIRAQARQVVTGVVVNQTLQAPKDYRRAIRLEMHYCEKYGIEDHLRHGRSLETDPLRFCQSMLGKVNYCLQLNSNDRMMRHYRTYLLEQFSRLAARR